MEFLMEHWLSVGAGIFLLSMVLYGHYRGFLRIAVTMSAVVISLLFVRFATPYATSFIRENTQIQSMVQKALLNAAGVDEIISNQEQFDTAPAIQREVIEQLRLPRQMKEVLLDNNNTEIYRLLGVNTFLEYVGTYLSNMILNLFGSVFLFVLAYIGLRVLMNVLDVVARLPIISGMNQIAGAAIGLIQGLFWLWGMFIVLDLFSGCTWAQKMLTQVQASMWLSFLYKNNLFNWLYIGLLRGLYK